MIRSFATHALGLVLTVAVATTTSAGVFTEDFSTTSHLDASNTTAVWDTAAGELRAPPFAPSLAGSVAVSGSPFAVDVAGDFAFVAAQTGGLRAIDISDPTSPVLSGSAATTSAYGVAVAGNYAYVGDGSAGLRVINISNPATPSFTATLDTPGSARGVAVDGNYAFVADGTVGGLQIIDISTPWTPSIVGSLDTVGEALDVVVRGDFAYVADRLVGGLLVVDISDPTAPDSVGGYDTPGGCWGVAVAGDRAYIADTSFGLLVLDITDPTNPTYLGSVNTPGGSRDVVLSGEYAYVGDYFTLQIVDVSDGANPAIIGSVATPGNASYIAADGEYVFIADGSAGGFQVAEVRHLTSLKSAGTGYGIGNAKHVVVDGHLAFVSQVDQGLKVMDVSDPASPALLGSCAVPYAWAAAVTGDFVYVAARDSGLFVVDVSDPTTPFVTGSIYAKDAYEDVSVDGNFAYVAAEDSGLVVLDISDPTKPSFHSVAPVTGQAWATAVEGDHVYIAAKSGGLRVYDVSDPGSPSFAGSIYTYVANDVEVRGDHAYLLTGTGLDVIDVSNPLTPVFSSHCAAAASNPYRLDVHGDVAYVLNYWVGVQTIDVSDPLNATQIEYVPLNGGSSHLAVSGDFLFVIDSPGLRTFQTYQRAMNFWPAVVGQSILFAPTPPDSVARVRVTPVQTPTVAWEWACEAVPLWQVVPTDGNWHEVQNPAIGLRWRSTHTYTSYTVNPTVDGFTLEYLFQKAHIDSVVDVPDDQGRWARICFERSGYDFADASTPIATYAVWRKVPAGSRAAGRAGCFRGTLDEMPRQVTPGQRLAVEPRSPLSASFPPGTWEALLSFPAVQQPSYIAVAQTLGDSTTSGIVQTAFCVTAHTTTPSLWFVSRPDTGYSIDNLAPPMPTSLQIAGTQLTWDPSAATDFALFTVHGSQTADFADAVVIDTTVNPALDVHGNPYASYFVTARDHAGNQSDPAGLLSTGVGAPALGPSSLPKRFSLQMPAPNPFRTNTTIRFDVPSAEHMTVDVVNVTGQRVRALVDAVVEPGGYSLSWSGRDASGAEVSPGVYFVRLRSESFVATRKLVRTR